MSLFKFVLFDLIKMYRIFNAQGLTVSGCPMLPYEHEACAKLVALRMYRLFAFFFQIQVQVEAERGGRDWDC